nr:hypothetical protein [Actinomycetota bacterium]
TLIAASCSVVMAREHDAAIRVGTVEDVEGARLLGAPTSPGFMVGYGEVLLSPDSRWIAYTAAGDDGYSRLFTIPTAGGTSRELSTRRDAYPVRWSSDGEYLLFIEGNAWHGEDTRLLRVRPDGTGRQTLVEGAGL